MQKRPLTSCHRLVGIIRPGSMALGLLVALTASLHAEMVSINPSIDALISANNSTNNYGGAGALAVSAAGLEKGEFETFLQFDLSTVQNQFNSTFGVGNWNIASAVLTLFPTMPSPNNAFFNASSATTDLSVTWMQADNWIEGTGTSNAPTTTGIMWNDRGSLISPNDILLGTSLNTTFNLSLQSGFVNDILAGQPTTFRLSANDAITAVVYNSRSFPTVANRPSLVITAEAVPEPASFGLIATAAGLVVMRSRRRAEQVLLSAAGR